jgi:hypothetical protein
MWFLGYLFYSIFVPVCFVPLAWTFFCFGYSWSSMPPHKLYDVFSVSVKNLTGILMEIRCNIFQLCFLTVNSIWTYFLLLVIFYLSFCFSPSVPS